MAVHTDFNITATQRDAIEELRRRMEGHMDVYHAFDPTFVFYRFLKARNWDLNKAEKMLKKSLQFRKRINIDALIQDYQPPEILQKLFYNFHIGYDKEGCQVIYVPLGKCDPKGVLKSTKPGELEKTFMRLISVHEYQLEQTMKKKNRWLPGFIIIVDCAGLTMANATYRKGVESLLRLVGIMQDNAPERLKGCFLINTLSFFPIPFTIFKHFMTSDTLRKFNLFGQEGWQEELLKIIDADVIPAFMGGTRTDPDGNPLCKTILNQMSTVDESYYLVKDGNPLANSPGVEKLVLMRSSSTKIPLQIKESGCVIEWEFKTKTRDIGFGLFYKETGDAGERIIELLPLERVDTTDYVESGIYKCEKPGEYFMLFDNSHSWMRSKELFYRVKVLSNHEFQDNIKNQHAI